MSRWLHSRQDSQAPSTSTPVPTTSPPYYVPLRLGLSPILACIIVGINLYWRQLLSPPQRRTGTMEPARAGAPVLRPGDGSPATSQAREAGGVGPVGVSYHAEMGGTFHKSGGQGSRHRAANRLPYRYTVEGHRVPRRRRGAGRATPWAFDTMRSLRLEGCERDNVPLASHCNEGEHAARPPVPTRQQPLCCPGRLG